MNWTWAHNVTTWAGLTAWFLAQLIKFLEHLIRKREVDFNLFVRTGGMPSSHTSACAAVLTSVGLRDGLDSTLFSVTLLVTFIVMYDAQGLRRAAGQQARILNQMLDQLRTQHRIQHGKLAELLGHTRLEVFAGFLLGIVVTLLLHALAGQRAGF